LALVAPMALAGGLAGLYLPHALWMAGLALVLRVLLPPDPPAPLGEGEGLLAQHVAIYASPRIAAPALGFVNYTAIYVAVLTLLPPLMPPAMVALAAAGMPLVSILLSLTLGVWALRHVSAVRLVQAGFAVGALSVVALALVWGQGGLMLTTALIFAGAMGIVQGASFAAIPQLNHSAGDRARASGAVAQLGNLGTTTGTPVLAYLIAVMGPPGVLVFALPLCLLGMALHLWLARRRS
jgi:DHA1 family inner membrane transport protein